MQPQWEGEGINRDSNSPLSEGMNVWIKPNQIRDISTCPLNMTD